jgi:hypothetical protein
MKRETHVDPAVLAGQITLLAMPVKRRVTRTAVEAVRDRERVEMTECGAAVREAGGTERCQRSGVEVVRVDGRG